MKKVSKKYVDQMKSRGKTVTTVKSVEAKEIAVPAEPVPMASMSAVLDKIAKDNKKTIQSFAEEVKKITGRKRKPWKFTVNRNDKGTITTVLADPID